MDRTVIDTWKAEEKEISEKLYTKLKGLNLLHPPTDEFKKCFSNDMFIKPNQKAFFHVTHYLFTILDPVEFKKRFYWPIVDKKSESDYRSTAVQYLNFINKKYDLQWPSIKSYLVVMPGGMKFITFLSDFVDFIIRDLIKQKEKLLNIDPNESGKINEFDLKKLELKNKCLKTNSARYIRETELQITKFKEKRDILLKKFDEIAGKIKLPVEYILQPLFFEQFEQNNQQYFDENCVKKSKKIVKFEEQLIALKGNITSFHNQDMESNSYNKDGVLRSLQQIQAISAEPLNITSDIKFDNLIGVFNKIYPHIEMKLQSIPSKSTEAVSFEESELYKMKSELIQVESQITKFLGVVKTESQAKSTPLRNPLSVNSALQSKFINTPPIKLDMSENKMTNNPRLPFLEDFVGDRSDSFSFISQPTILFPQRTTKKSNNDSMRMMPPSQNKSKIVDPMKLLRSLNKENSRCRNLNVSTLATKWKERETLFGIGDRHESPETPTSSRKTPKILVLPPDEEGAVVLPISLDLSLKDTSIVYQKKSYGVQKIQNASFNLHNLSTSPSGRLDSLVNIDQRDFSKILVNERPLNDSALNKSGVLGNYFANESFEQKEKILKTPAFNRSLQNNENDLNLSNLCHQFDLKTSLGDDTLFNISDSVLKDIPM